MRTQINFLTGPFKGTTRVPVLCDVNPEHPNEAIRDVNVNAPMQPDFFCTYVPEVYTISFEEPCVPAEFKNLVGVPCNITSAGEQVLNYSFCFNKQINEVIQQLLAHNEAVFKRDIDALHAKHEDEHAQHGVLLKHNQIAHDKIGCVHWKSYTKCHLSKRFFRQCFDEP